MSPLDVFAITASLTCLAALAVELARPNAKQLWTKTPHS
jgi:hypothetical protein